MGKKSVQMQSADASLEKSEPTEVRAAGPNLMVPLIEMMKTAQLTQRKQARDMLVHYYCHQHHHCEWEIY